MEFFKYHALGNDMVIIDPAKFTLPLSTASIRLICNRNFGLGADGICYGPLNQTPLKMHFFNPDGSESFKSGNGLRIFARYLWDYGYVKTEDFIIQIADESIQVKINDTYGHTITTSMGRLSFLSRDIPMKGFNREVIKEKVTIEDCNHIITAVTIGNPHCVIFSDDNDVINKARQLGPIIEIASLFPQRTNVQFVNVIDPHTIKIGIWERGAGYTLASGSSASAAAGAAIKTGRCISPVTVHMPGGTALVNITPKWDVRLSGSVEAVGMGQFASDFINKLHQTNISSNENVTL
ncbi:MAG: diaminopimelate epimerase [Anaerolineae bacterium]|nr:diaminopimelate epimerase [Anaerolineae bacterium]